MGLVRVVSLFMDKVCPQDPKRPNDMWSVTVIRPHFVSPIDAFVKPLKRRRRDLLDQPWCSSEGVPSPATSWKSSLFPIVSVLSTLVFERCPNHLIPRRPRLPLATQSEGCLSLFDNQTRHGFDSPTFRKTGLSPPSLVFWNEWLMF